MERDPLGVPSLPSRCSPTKSEASDDLLIALGTLPVKVREQPPALSDHHEQSAPAVIVVRGRAEMLGQMLDPLSEERDLDLR